MRNGSLNSLFLLPFFLLLVFSGCKGSTIPDEENNNIDEINPKLQELRNNLELWQQSEPLEHSYEYSGICYACDSAGRRDVNYYIEQSSTGVQKRYIPGSSYYKETPDIESDVKTINQLFSDLENKLKQNPNRFDVEYDPLYNFPWRVKEDGEVVSVISLFSDGKTAKTEYFRHLFAWHEQDLENYQYTLTRYCDCPLPEQVKIHFENNLLVQVTPAERQTENGSTRKNRYDITSIQRSFAIIGSLLSQEKPFSVSYHDTYHFPTELVWDESRTLESPHNLYISEFEVGNTEVADKLQVQKSLWQENEPFSYRFEYSIGLCDCLASYFQITVEDGQVIETLYFDEAFGPDPMPEEYWPAQPKDIGDLFEEIEHQLTTYEAPKDSLNGFYVYYDDNLGYPSLYVRESDIPSDDGSLFHMIKNFEVLAP